MKKLYIILIIFLMGTSLINAQSFSVYLIDDDANGTDNSATIATAINNAGYVYSTRNIENDGAPTYADLKTYDMIIWHTGNDGFNINLWDTTYISANGAHAARYNAALMQFADSGGIIWVDGVDYMYDVFGFAPDTFHAGDFIYDKLGISKYLSQSKTDDGDLGVSYLDKTSQNNITTVNPVKWEWSTLHFADGFELTSSAIPLYKFGGIASYPLLGQTTMLYNVVGNTTYITSSVRVARLGDGSNPVQADVNTFIKEMLDHAKNNGFNSVSELNINSNVNVYPNPATKNITLDINIDNLKNAQISIIDITGKIVLTQDINSNLSTINVNGIKSGFYNMRIRTNKGIVNKKIIIQK